MAASDFSNAFATIRKVENWVCDVVLAHRNNGLRSEHAKEQAALALGISKRKARSFFYGEASGVAPSEFQQMREGWVRHMEQQADEHARKSADIRAKLRQTDMGL